MAVYNKKKMYILHIEIDVKVYLCVCVCVRMYKYKQACTCLWQMYSHTIYRFLLSQLCMMLLVPEYLIFCLSATTNMCTDENILVYTLINKDFEFITNIEGNTKDINMAMTQIMLLSSYYINKNLIDCKGHIKYLEFVNFFLPTLYTISYKCQLQ